MKDIHEFKYGWYGRLEDLTEELEENGFTVEEAKEAGVAIKGIGVVFHFSARK